MKNVTTMLLDNGSVMVYLPYLFSNIQVNHILYHLLVWCYYHLVSNFLECCLLLLYQQAGRDNHFGCCYIEFFQSTKKIQNQRLLLLSGKSNHRTESLKIRVDCLLRYGLSIIRASKS